MAVLGAGQTLFLAKQLFPGEHYNKATTEISARNPNDT